MAAPSGESIEALAERLRKRLGHVTVPRNFSRVHPTIAPLLKGHGLMRMYRPQRMIDKDDLPTGEWIGDKTNDAVPPFAPQEHSTAA